MQLVEHTIKWVEIKIFQTMSFAGTAGAGKRPATRRTKHYLRLKTMKKAISHLQQVRYPALKGVCKGQTAKNVAREALGGVLFEAQLAVEGAQSHSLYGRPSNDWCHHCRLLEVWPRLMDQVYALMK